MTNPSSNHGGFAFGDKYYQTNNMAGLRLSVDVRLVEEEHVKADAEKPFEFDVNASAAGASTNSDTNVPSLAESLAAKANALVLTVSSETVPAAKPSAGKQLFSKKDIKGKAQRFRMLQQQELAGVAPQAPNVPEAPSSKRTKRPFEFPEAPKNSLETLINDLSGWQHTNNVPQSKPKNGCAIKPTE